MGLIINYVDIQNLAPEYLMLRLNYDYLPAVLLEIPVGRGARGGTGGSFIECVVVVVSSEHAMT